MMQSECIFCKIVSGEIPSTVVFESDQFLAFKDIKPEAPTHVLVIPKSHVETLTSIKDEAMLLGLWKAAVDVTKKLGVADSCKFAVNNGKTAGQLVPHVHIHILSQRG